MAMSVVYGNANGVLLHEIRGGAQHDYVGDTLGSTVAVLEQTGKPAYEAEYWPYGQVRTQSGANPSPFGYVGTPGYFKDLAEMLYVRARGYSTVSCQWMSVDPLWPQEEPYSYVSCQPATLLDPSGLRQEFRQRDLLGEAIIGYLCCADQAAPAIRAADKFCKQNGFGKNEDGSICNAMQHCMWACLIVQNCDGLAGTTGAGWSKTCTDMHEKDAPGFWKNCPGYRPVPSPYKKNPPSHKCMDLFNNAIGIGCGSATDCYSCCLRNIKSGGLQVIKPPKTLPPGWRSPRTGCRDNPKKVKIPSVDVA